MAFHSRSNSLPSTSHPLVSLVDEQLTGLRTSQSALTFSSLSRNLETLQDLYDSVEKLLQLHSSEQTVCKEDADDLLERSLKILDLCNSAKEAFLHTTECLQEIQTVLRRKRGSEIELVKEADSYFYSKRTIRKMILKALKNVSHMENKHKGSSSELISILGEVEAASSTVLEALLSFISGPEKKSRWSSVAKIFGHKRVWCDKEQEGNEIATTEAALKCLARGGSMVTENLQSQLSICKKTSHLCTEYFMEVISAICF